MRRPVDLRPLRRLRPLLAIVPVATILAGTTSCSAPAKGSLMLAITTDMQVPKDGNLLSVFVTSDSAIKLDYLGRLQPQGSLLFPATLAIVQPDNPDASLFIRVTLFQDQKARVMRDVVTTVPRDRTALLRVPLGILDDGDVSGNLPGQYMPGSMVAGVLVPDGDSNYSPIDEPGAVLRATCSFTNGLTSINGECVDATLKSSTLPDYSDGAVFGAGGSCFDVKRCFASASVVTGLDTARCLLPLPAGTDAATYNLALATQTTGACVGTGPCFVPLVSDKDAGWYVSQGVVHLLPGVCKSIANAGTQLYQAAGTCPAQTLSDPVCQPGA